MREPTYFILAALQHGPLHGYGITRRAHKLSGGTVRLSAGTLYGALERLTEGGLVQAGAAYAHEGRTRRDYTLTSAGRDALVAEAERMRRAASLVVTGPAGAA